MLDNFERKHDIEPFLFFHQLLGRRRSVGDIQSAIRGMFSRYRNRIRIGIDRP